MVKDVEDLRFEDSATAQPSPPPCPAKFEAGGTAIDSVAVYVDVCDAANPEPALASASPQHDTTMATPMPLSFASAHPTC